MQIRSIKETDHYKSMEFGQIFPQDIKEKVPTKSDGKHEVYTPNGWQPVLGWYKTEPMETIKVSTESGSIECAKEHLIETEHGLLPADKCGNVLVKTISGLQRCNIVETGEIKNLYDLQIPGPHIWYTSGIQSHNSILLPHSGIACMKRGANILHITLELSKVKTALRYAGAISNVEVHRRFEPQNRARMVTALEKAKTMYNGDLKIFEFPPDEISVVHIYQLIDKLRKQDNWHPDVLVIDYLELLISRRASDNDKEYNKQKQVSTQIRGVAKNEDVLIFTATQTNREDPKAKKGPGGGVIGINRVAESFGKMMPMDYVVTANQELDEYNNDHPQLRLWVAKNRNGQKNKKVTISINYKTFRLSELKPKKLGGTR